MSSGCSIQPICVICKTDMFGTIVSVGAGSSDLLGYEPYELMGKKLCRFILGGSKDADRTMIVQSIRSNGKHQFEFQMQRKDSSIVSVVSSNTWLSNEARMLCLISQKQGSASVNSGIPEISD